MDMTQWIGVMSFGIAGFLCLVRGGKAWIAIGLINLFFSAECAIGLRHLLHDLGGSVMGSQYAERVPVQMGLIISAFIVGSVLLASVQLTNPDRLLRLSLFGTALSSVLFAIESVSLHDLDRILYLQAGPALLIGWLWFSLASITGIAAACSRLRASRRLQK